MPKITVNQPNPPTVYTKRYDRFAGVDFSTDPSRIDNSRSPYAVFQSTHPVRGGWIDLPLIGAMPVIAPIRGTELYYRITRTATRKRVQAKSLPSTSFSHSNVYSQLFAFLRKASC